MAVLVDTNVIVDVLYGDLIWAEWSDEQITRHSGDIYINPIIYSELCYKATSTSEVDMIVEDIGLQYDELSHQALFLAARAFQRYRQRGGSRTSPLADFFIGAHAEAAGWTLLTRDATRYKTYFPSVALICP